MPAARKPAPKRRPRRRPRRAHPAGRLVTVVAVGIGSVAVLVGAGVAALNEPTAVPVVSANLVVLSQGELLGSRLVSVGAALLTLATGLLLGTALGGPRRRRAGRR